MERTGVRNAICYFGDGYLVMSGQSRFQLKTWQRFQVCFFLVQFIFGILSTPAAVFPGTKAWEFTAPGVIRFPPAVAPDGTICFEAAGRLIGPGAPFVEKGTHMVVAGLFPEQSQRFFQQVGREQRLIVFEGVIPNCAKNFVTREGLK